MARKSRSITLMNPAPNGIFMCKASETKKPCGLLRHPVHRVAPHGLPTEELSPTRASMKNDGGSALQASRSCLRWVDRKKTCCRSRLKMFVLFPGLETAASWPLETSPMGQQPAYSYWRLLI